MCQSCGWGSGPLDSLFRTSESELQTRLRFVYKPGCITRTSCLLHKVVVARRMCVVVSLTWLIDTGRVTIDNIVSRPTCMFVLSVLAILPQTCCDHTCILRVKMPKNQLAGILWSPDQTWGLFIFMLLNTEIQQLLRILTRLSTVTDSCQLKPYQLLHTYIENCAIE